MLKLFCVAAVISLLVLIPNPSWAQEDELAEIEAELEKASTKRIVEDAKVDRLNTDTKAVSFQGLTNLQPFSEVTILQKKFLPKTGRFQVHGALMVGTNDPFFTNIGPAGRISYFFTEALGIELNSFIFSSSTREATKDLANNNGVTTASLVTPKSYIGADLVWIPIYGKMTFKNEKIIPFDLYFSVGPGSTGTTNNQSASTLHLGTGQIFAVSKSFAYRWDFSWNFFSANGIDGSAQSFNNLFLSVGASMFFPEAKYR
jgi:outer membrane beta-barrel protein